MLKRIIAPAVIAGALMSLLGSPAHAATDDYVPPLEAGTYNVSHHYGPTCPAVPGAGTFHQATDLSAPDGTPIYAAHAGTVSKIVTTGSPTITVTSEVYGKTIDIGYTHMWDPNTYVHVGQKVRAGEHIADVGNAGISNGPHLHFSVKVDGASVDPILYMDSHGASLTAGANRVIDRTPAPKTCELYATATQAVWAEADYHSKKIGTLSKNAPITVTIPSKPSGSTFDKVRTKDGKVGYVLSGRLSPHLVGDYSSVPVKTGGKRGEVISRGNWYLFDSASPVVAERGIADLIEPGQRFTLTGRKATGYLEVTFEGRTGWVGDTATYEDAPKPTKPSKPAKPGASVPVHRFWSPKFDNAHFYTSSTAEADGIRKTDKNWTYEGTSFRVWQANGSSCAAGQVPVYRFYSSAFASHFYTVSKPEADAIRKTDKNWADEGVAFCETQKKDGNQPVYRFWSPTYKKHFYTTNTSEMKTLRDKDPAWNYEGVAWYAPTK